MEPASSPPAVSIVVCANEEGRSLRPCLNAWLAAVAAFEQMGGRAHIVVSVFGDVARTCEEVTRLTDAGVELAVAQGKTIGEAFNRAVERARHDIVVVADGADLVTSTTLVDMVRELQSAPENVILHPAAVLRFGRFNDEWRPKDMRTHAVSAGDILCHDLWPLLAVARRTVFQQVNYRELSTERGLGPTAWTWNIDTVARGFVHGVVDSVVQLRRVPFLVNGRADPVLVLPPVDVEALGATLPPARPEEEPPRHAARIPERVISRAARMLGRARDAVERRLPRASEDNAAGRGLDPVLRELAWIDPAVSWTLENRAHLPVWEAGDDGYGAILSDVVTSLTGVSAIVAVPWLGTGGGDAAAAAYARAISELPEFRGRTALLTTADPAKTHHERVPAGVRLIQMPRAFEDLAPDWRQRLIAQLMVLVQPTTVLSVNCHHLTDAMHLFGPHILGCADIRLTLFGFDTRGDGLPSSPIADQGLRRSLGGLRRILTDNTVTARFAADALGLDAPAIKVLPLPVGSDVLPALDTTSAAYSQELASEDIRLIWPHRLDPDKRPDVLPRIARELRARGVGAQIDVWGEAVMSDAQETIAALEGAGIHYRGPYRGGLAAVDTSPYHGLLLTSGSEGMPLVLVESLVRGLPVIATSVGGVPDLIEDGRTGFLTAGPEDIEGFADAIESLRSVRTRRALIEAGHRAARSRHSWEAFRAEVAEEFSPPREGAAAALDRVDG